MIRKMILFLLIMTINLCPLPVLASEGAIEVNLPKEMVGEKVVIKSAENEQTVLVDEDGIARFVGVTEGEYEIQVPETSKYTFVSSRISIPMWSEEEGKMSYDIKIYPKYSRKPRMVEQEIPQVPHTGDASRNTVYVVFLIISCIILMIISCHNHFKCGRMSVKYSKDGGHNNGNDNDTENPCCSCRIGISSSGTID